MATFEFILPELGEGIESGDVVQVLVALGDTITAEQPVIELETDKAVVEVPTPVAGKITALHIETGTKVSVGQRILTLDTNGSAAAIAAAPPAPAAPAAPSQPAGPAPEKVVSAATPPSPPSSLSRQPVPSPLSPAVAVPAAPPTDAAPERRLAVAAAPSVRRFAREIGIDINQVAGSGPGGRISVEDVKSYARQLRQAVERTPVAALPALGQTLPDFSRWGAIQRQAMSNVRRATAEQMARSWATVPHVTQFDRADITDLEQLRQRFARRVEAAGGRLTVTAIVVKIIAAALKIFPQFNASVDMANHEVIYKQYYHIGVAVDTERGLLVPVIRDVDRKNIIHLAVELTQLAERARTRKTTLEEMQGGTFTVTNLGGLGGTNFAPIVNTPEVAILGMSRSSMEPVYRDGQFVPRLMLPLSLSYDHRLIDGADGVRFLRWIAEALEQPFLLALEG